MQPSLHDLQIFMPSWALVPSTWYLLLHCNKKKIKIVFPLLLDNTITKLITSMLLFFARIDRIAFLFFHFWCLSLAFSGHLYHINNDETSSSIQHITLCLTINVLLETINNFAYHHQLNQWFPPQLDGFIWISAASTKISSFDHITAALTAYLLPWPHCSGFDGF